MKHAVFLDTMVYLHYRPVEEIDWHRMLGVPSGDSVVIVVSGVTLREIDKHKNQSARLRERARRVSERIAGWLTADHAEVRPGVAVVGALRPPDVDYAAEGLDSNSNDDVLVASALAYQRANPETGVTLVTQDVYPQMRARGLGLRALALPDDLKLPVEEDPTEKENRDLRRQLQQLQAALPVLDLQFSDSGGKSLRVVIRDVGPLTQSELAAAMAEAERQHPPVDALRPRRAPDEARPPGPDILGRMGASLQREVQRAREIEAAVLGPIPETEYTRYEEERVAFLAELPSYLAEVREWERMTARAFTLEMELVNTGSTPAVDIDVHWHVPDGVHVTDEDPTTDEPEPPRPPRRPRRNMDLLRDGLQMPSILGLSTPFPPLPSFDPRPATPRNVSSLDIEETESYDIRCHVRRVKHGLAEPLPTLYLQVPDDVGVRPFQISYSLHAGNLPRAVEDVLNVILVSA
jgi:hypothetical protein